MYIICAVIKMLHTFTKRYSIKKLSFLIKNTNLPTKRTNNDKGGTWGNIDRRVGKNIRSIKKNLKLAPNICYAISYTFCAAKAMVSAYFLVHLAIFWIRMWWRHAWYVTLIYHFAKLLHVMFLDKEIVFAYYSMLFIVTDL